MMKFGTSVKLGREVAKSLYIDTHNLKIKVKEENCTTSDAKDIIFLLQALHVYTQIVVFFTSLSEKLQLD